MYNNGFVVNTNMASLLVQRNLEKTTNEMTALMERITTGYRINRASDDPSGMAISTHLSSQISSIDVAKSNSQTGASMLQTAEGDLNTIKSNLSTMKTLILQAQNGTLSTAEREALDETYQQALTEITRIAQGSNYSGIKLLDGSNSSAGKITLQVDIDNSSNNRIDISSAYTSATATSLGIDATGISTVSGANAAEALVEAAYNAIIVQKAKVGGFVSRLEANVNRLDVKSENLQSANSVIRDADTASDTALLTTKQILQQSSASLLQQSNQSLVLLLSLISS